MKKNLNITIVGAGGGASYLLPQLIRMHPINRLTIFDADILEDRNLDRQLFNESCVEQNKAEALAETLGLERYCGQLVLKREWFTEATIFPEDEDIVFSCVDNHPARRHIMLALDRHFFSFKGASGLDTPTKLEENIHGYFMGNEYFDAEAYIYNPAWRNTIMDPRKRHPELLTSNLNDPTSCQSETVLSAHPQLATANARSADHALHLSYLWDVEFPEVAQNVADKVTTEQNFVAYVREIPLSIRSMKFNYETKTMQGLDPIEKKELNHV